MGSSSRSYGGSGFGGSSGRSLGSGYSGSGSSGCAPALHGLPLRVLYAPCDAREWQAYLSGRPEEKCYSRVAVHCQGSPFPSHVHAGSPPQAPLARGLLAAAGKAAAMPDVEPKYLSAW